MKKYISILLLVIVLITSLIACSQPAVEKTAAASPSQEAIVPLDPQGHYDLLNGKTLAMIYRPESAQDIQRGLENFFKTTYSLDLHMQGIVYVDSLTDGLLMLRSHKADALNVMRITGRYLAQRNNDLIIYINEIWAYSTRMIFSQEKKAQLDKVNSAIKAMQEDGTLDKLVEQWITNLPAGKEPSGGVLPVIEGADTLKVGISGDEPPLDYIAADGTPGGFNMAVLSEISRRANLNIKLVTVNSSARFTALQSGKIDAFLWNNPSKPIAGFTLSPTPSAPIASPSTFLNSESYLDGRGSMVVLK